MALTANNRSLYTESQIHEFQGLRLAIAEPARQVVYCCVSSAMQKLNLAHQHKVLKEFVAARVLANGEFVKEGGVWAKALPKKAE